MVFACGVPDFSGIATALADTFAQHAQPVEVPDIAVGVSSFDGYSLAGGFAWGTKTGGWFAGTDVQRVLLDVHHDPERTLLAVTYGRYDSVDPWGFAFDVGPAADSRGAGAAGRVELGVAGIFVRFAGEAMIDPHPRVDGRIEAMLDVTTMIGSL